MENDNQDKDQKLKDFIDLIADGKKHVDSSLAYSRFRSRIKSQNNYSYQRKLIKRWFYIAAIIIPFLFLGHFTYQYFRLSAYTGQRMTTISEIVVPNGSKTQFVLQDGTKIWLNSGSVFQCDKDFGKEFRKIKLLGEAYLEVAPNQKCPFIVSTNEVNIKVLGTKFNVNAYQENEEIKIALLEGSVEMSVSGHKPLLLSPNDVANYNLVSKETKILNNATSNSLDWIDNKLIFDGETFEQIILTLERNFNVKVNIHNDVVNSCCFVGDFINNETIEQIFNIMSSNGKFKYKIKGNIIDVY